MTYFLRKIRCPRHFVLKGGIDPRTKMPYRPFKMMLNPLVRNMPKWAFEKWPSLYKFIPVKDKYGRRIRDNDSFFQPCMSAVFFVHHVYDPRNKICTYGCKGRCLEALGKLDHNKNKRLKFAVPA